MALQRNTLKKGGFQAGYLASKFRWLESNEIL
jgi:hypothetical protein